MNHPSWWDPLTCLLLTEEYLPWMEHYAPIEAAALRRYGFFRRLGVFPVDAGTGLGGLQLVRAGREILAMEGAVLWLTPQGGFADARVRPVALKDGLAALLARSATPVTVIPLALEYCFWNERLPEILVNVGEGICIRGGGEVKALTARLENALTVAQDELAVLAMTREKANFETLLEGRAGVGLVYDFWSRLREAWRGRRYEAEHGSLRRG